MRMHKMTRENCRSIRMVCLFWMLAQLGCGAYSFSSSGAAHIKTIAIPIFEDRTSEFGIRETLTSAVIEEFTRDNTLKITERRNADSVLEGTILRVDDRAGAFARDETVQDVKVFVTVQITYQDMVKRKTIWEENITQWGTFDPDLGTQSRETGINEAIEKIASDILNKSVSSW
jgi:hypothetical protein